jgi:DNA-damage-inducible protein J
VATTSIQLNTGNRPEIDLERAFVAPLTSLHYNVIQSTQTSIIMAANQLVQTRIDGAIKEEAAAVLAAMGLTVSDAVRLLLTRIAREHALPFDPLIPNATTVAAMKEARAGNLPCANSVAALKTALHADD